MTQGKTIRPAMTAIAAAIALSTSPLFAQSADQPTVTTTPAVDVAPAPVADPVVPVADTPTVAEPVVKKSTAPSKPTGAKTTAVRARPAPARAPVTVRAAPPLAAPIEAPVAEAPAATPLPVAPEAPIAAAPPAAAPSSAQASTIDILPTAGLGVLGLLLLGGAALAIRSRRRRRLDEETEWQQVEAEPEAIYESAPVVAPEPAIVATPAVVAAAEPAIVADSETQPTTATGAGFIAPVNDLPEDFDISRFGAHVQDAYRGPTEDNPSMSLKTRLSRASGMDQQERKLDAEVEAVTGEPALDETDPTPAEIAVAQEREASATDGTDEPIAPTYTH